MSQAVKIYILAVVAILMVVSAIFTLPYTEEEGEQGWTLWYTLGLFVAGWLTSGAAGGRSSVHTTACSSSRQAQPASSKTRVPSA